MLSHVLPSSTLCASRRAYSVFSSKPGGGRYFNSAKPHKVAPAASPANAKEEPTDEPSSPVLTTKTSDDVPAPPPPPATASPPVQTPRTPLHPSFSAQTYPLHQFFALHRPLLQLSLPTATFFETSSASTTTPFEPPSTSTSTSSPANVLAEAMAESEGDADADAARQLARAMAINRVSSMVDWTETLARLGDRESQEVLAAPVELPLGLMDELAVEMDSTKRKRRKKMSKHKYKKRRRLQRAERRKMGK